jgi:hypothetical protein
MAQRIRSKHENEKRRPKANLYLPVLTTISVVIVIYMMGSNYLHLVDTEKQIHIRGRLIEWSEIALSNNRGKTPRFTLVGHSNDFRIDPYLFRDAMNGIMPAAFRPGADVDVTVDSREYKSPVRPVLNPEAKIVWVNGLAIDGVKQFGIEDVVRREKKDRIWSYVLLAFWLAACVYFWLNWRSQTMRSRESAKCQD